MEYNHLVILLIFMYLWAGLTCVYVLKSDIKRLKSEDSIPKIFVVLFLVILWPIFIFIGIAYGD